MEKSKIDCYNFTEIMKMLKEGKKPPESPGG